MTTPSAQFFTVLFSGMSWHSFFATLQPVIPILITVSPIILTFGLFLIFWDVWVRYIRAEFFYKEKTLLLEILLPKETMKSPAAMELFLTALHQTGGEGSWYDVYWLGKTRPWFSLELVSIEGQVHFYIWTRAAMKNFIESSLYAQFPGIEVHEVDDYAKAVHFDPEKMGIWGCEFKYAKGNAYPIKTYVDYGLDKDPKEEYKVDPLAPMLEYLGSIGANQQVWIQFIVRAHKDDQKKAGHLWKTVDLWKEEAEGEVHKILGRDPKTRTSKGADDDSGMSSIVRLSPGETDTVEAIGRAMSKLGFDVGIRGMYIANKDSFVGTNIPGLISSFKQFNTENLNGFKIKIGVWSTAFGDPWQDFKKIRENRMLHVLLETYKRRMYFYPPYRYKGNSKGKILVMNTEELATVFHFPGQVAATPTLARIPSKKSQAPANLPI
jgi:hypothetical protein